jgi:hypothetical protein
MEPGGLLVMADNTSGWADLGNQARVIHTLTVTILSRTGCVR